MTSGAEPAVHADAQTLALSLEPQVIKACDGRLDDVRWFRTDWQRGGAATARAMFRDDNGDRNPVVVKLPIVQRELTWLRRLQANGQVDPVVPRVSASGEALSGYDLAWVVIEYIPHGPLGIHWHNDHVTRIAEAAARFQQAGTAFPVDRESRVEEWSVLAEQAQASLRINKVDEKKRWNTALKSLRDRLDDLVDEWRSRATGEWIHGDLQFANAMSRESIESGPVCLIDLAEVRPGHWVEDAVYLERQLWARPDLLKATKPVRAIAAARKKLGLAVDPDYPRLSMIRRALLAGTAPKFMKSEGNPRHLAACLEWLELAMAELK